MIDSKSDVINKLFFNEMKKLIDKYNNIDSETVRVIETIEKEVEDRCIREYILSDNDKLIEIVDDYKKNEDLNVDKMIFFAWYNLNIEDVGIYKTSRYYEELITEKYLEIEDYIIYKDKNDLTEYARGELDYMLDMDSQVDRLLDKDILVDIFINKTTKEELVEEILLNDDIEDTLGLIPDYAFTLKNGTEYKFAKKE